MTVTYKYITQTALEKALLEDRSYLGLNSNAYLFPKWRVGAWQADGSVTLADCTNPAKQKIVGISNAPILSGARGLFVQRGIVPGAITGLGAQAGDPIYLAVVAGTLTKVIPIGSGVTVIQVGVAETDPDTGHVNDLRVELTAGSGSSGGGGGGGVDLGQVASAIEASKIASYFNSTLAAIPAFRAIAWGPGSSIVPADAGDPAAYQVAGITVATVAAQSFGPVQKYDVLRGACAALSAQPGQPVFLDIGPGGNLTLTAPADPAAVIQVGYAVPRDSTTGAAIDLFVDIQRALIP